MIMKRQFVFLGLAALVGSTGGCMAPPIPGHDVKSASDVGDGPAFEAEKMGRFGGSKLRARGASGGGIEGPFKGVALLGNGDHVRVKYDFPSAGRYAFAIKGASSDGKMSGVTVFVADLGGMTVFFENNESEVLIAEADVETAGVHTIRLQLTTDGGTNDTYIDSFEVSRKGDVTPPPAPPSKGAFETGIYRNMFAEFGYDQAVVQQRLEMLYEQLFHGNIEDQTIMFPVGSNENGPLAYIMDLWNNDVRSEGMSYGMMISVQMNRQEDFNAIWNWSKTYMYQSNPKHPCYGYFAWQMSKDGKKMDEMPAPDGEEYFIMALMFASHRWGDGEGIYNYKKEALDLLDKYKNRQPITGVSTNAWGTRTITGVALMNPDWKMPRFTPDTTNFQVNGDHTDPSYHLPAFYELFALWGPEKDKKWWQEAAQASRDFFTRATHKKTGLTPDYSNFDGTPVSASFNKGSNTFRWDAWRTAMNWGMDYHWFAKDERQKELTNRIQRFFEKEGIYTHRQCYTLSGGQAEGESAKWHSPGLAATNGATSLAATDRRAWAFVNAVMGTPVPTGLSRYYDGVLYMFGMLHLSGNYRIYMPGHAEKVAAEKAAAEKAAAEKAAQEAGARKGSIEVTLGAENAEAAPAEAAPAPEAAPEATPEAAPPQDAPAPAKEPAEKKVDAKAAAAKKADTKASAAEKKAATEPADKKADTNATADKKADSQPADKKADTKAPSDKKAATTEKSTTP